MSMYGADAHVLQNDKNERIDYSKLKCGLYRYHKDYRLNI